MVEKNNNHGQKLIENRLRRIENKLRKIEILLLKNVANEKKIKKEIVMLEKEEKIVEKEQRKLEEEEKKVLKEMERVEDEEKWHVEVQYNCKTKIMDDNNMIMCHKTGKNCDMMLCPLWKG